VNGEQAKANADHFIAVHVKATSGGRTYAQLGTDQNAVKAQIADAEKAGQPTAALETKLADLTKTRETVFKGETLRGLLLNAYAFGTMGRIAGLAAIAAFIGAGLLLILSVLGLVHARRIDPDVEVMPPKSAA
jgi:hypothetical protein